MARPTKQIKRRLKKDSAFQPRFRSNGRTKEGLTVFVPRADSSSFSADELRDAIRSANRGAGGLERAG
ncbi:MAG: hypothetical protein ACU0BS_03325 [Hasllibacter sp.]